MSARVPLSLHALRGDYLRLSPAERRLWRWPMMWVSAAAITAVPLAYAALSLCSADDPYGHLNRLPVALVNLDQGAVASGVAYTLGQDVLRTLTARPEFQYTTYPTEQDARNAVRRGNAYFSLTIPKTFSQQAVAGTSAQHGTLNVYVAEGRNYFASRIATTFAGTLATDLNATLGENRWTIVQRSVASTQQDLTRLRAATAQVASSATQLKIGTRQLAYSAGTLATGARHAADGGRQLVKGATALSGTVTRLTDGTSTLTRTLKTLETATPGPGTLDPLKTGTTRLISGAGDLAGTLDTLNTGAGTLATAATATTDRARRLAQGAASLGTTLPAVQGTLNRLEDSAARLATSARTASSASTPLAGAITQLTGALPALQGSVNQLGRAAPPATGTRPPTPGTASLNALQAGLDQVNSSARQFSVTAGTFAQQTADMNANLRTQFLVPQAIRENVAALAAQAERVRADSVTLRARLDQLGAPIRRAAAPDTGSSSASAPSATAAALAAQLRAASADLRAAMQGAATLDSTAAQLTTSLRAVTSGADTVTTQATAARTGAGAAARSATALGTGATTLASTARTLQNTAATLSGTATRAATDARTLQGAARDLQSGVTTLVDSATALKSTLGQITRQLPDRADLTATRNGARTLAAQSADLGTGLNTVATSADRIQTTATTVNTDAGTLVNRLNDLQTRIPTRILTSSGTPASLSISVTSDIQTFAPVTTNGAASAPHIMALSLWVGVTLTTFIFPFQQLPRSGRRSSQLARVIRKAAAPAALVTVQALLVVLGVHLLGVTYLHPAQVAFTAVASSLTFLITVLALIFCFGAAGRLLALILLALQLAATGSAFPVETAPRAVQVIHTWLPVTPSADALRNALSGAFEGQYATLMLTLLAVFTVGSGLALLGRHRWEFVPDDDFKPLISTPIISKDVPPDPYIDAPTDTPRDIPERAVPN